jgi:predicted GIY-YIG superfamily endonuclease
MAYYVYILMCADGTYYTGYTTDLTRRVKQHQSGSIPRAYTKARRPVELVWAQEFESKEEARTNEKKIKSWSTARKETVIQNDRQRTDQIFQDRGAVNKNPTP